MRATDRPGDGAPAWSAPSPEGIAPRPAVPPESAPVDGPAASPAADAFHELIRSDPSGVYAVDPELRIVEVSAGARRVLAAHEPLVGRDVSDLLRAAWPEPQASEAVARFQRVLVTGEPCVAPPVTEVPPDLDPELAFAWRLDRILLPDGRFGVACRFHDLGERLRLERALRDSEQRLRTVLTALDEGYCVCELVYDAAGRPVDYEWLEVNPLFETMTGLANAVGTRAYERIPNLEPHWLESYTRVALGGEMLRCEQHSAAMGRWFDVFAMPVPPHGRFAVVFRDVTARRAAELERKRSRAVLDAVLESLPVGVIIADENGRLLRWNRANRHLWGLEGVDPQSTDGIEKYAEWQGWWYPDGPQLQAHEWGMARALLNREVVLGDLVEIQPFDGSPRRVIVNLGAPVLLPDGELAGAVVAQTDVTESLRAEEALREANRRKDEFLATLAHELRNPLAPIRNAAQLLGSPKLTSEALDWARHVIQRQVRHMAYLLDDLLDVARITRGKLELRRQHVLLSAVVDAAIETARPAIDAKRHSFAVALPAGMVELDADPQRLAQVIANLLTNAAKYTDPGGSIALVATLEPGEVRIGVRDDGIGLSREALDSIFGMFSQVDDARHRSEGGLGIGLALVKGLVELHGGRVEAHSDGVGRGSEFVVRLPLRPAAAAAVESAHGGASAAPGCRVLLADDNRDAAESLAMLLQMAGHEVRIAHDGVAAVELAAQFRPDVALLDIGMPGLDGYAVARTIRAQPWGTAPHLVALTGWGQEEDRRRSREAGFDEHLTKPVDPARVEELVARHAAARATAGG